MIYKQIPKFFIIMLTLLLSACSTTQQLPSQPTVHPVAPQLTWQQRKSILSEIDGWTIKGAMAVKTGDQGGSASVDWQQHGDYYTIRLFGPLGMGAVQVIGTPEQVTLKKSAKEVYHATTAQQLLQQQVGWNLPVANLNYWIKGLPVPGQDATTKFDKKQRITMMNQDGWHIQYIKYKTVKGIDLPSKMTLNYPDLRLKLIINQWQLSSIKRSS